MDSEKKTHTYRTRRSTTKTDDGVDKPSSGYSTSKSSSHSYYKKDRSLETKAIEEKIDAWFEANKESGLRKLISAAKLMEVGAHIGLSTKLWNPKMKNYIYPRTGNRLQVIDILKTMVFLDRAYNFLKDIAKDGGRILFVATR
jgi:small subunit ribosomal protein S2